jgi:hypothetical protein
VTSRSIIHMDLHKPITSWLMHSWSTFGARANEAQTQTHKTHHGPNLGEATTFPLIVFSMFGHTANIQMSFCPRTPSWNPEIPEIGTPTTLEAHNVLCKPPIEVRSKTKLYPCQTLSNDMWHATCTWVNQSDSWLLVVESQI